MEGPTPVSALIHAATMVVAGVYLVARLFPVFSLDQAVLHLIAYVGAISALLAAAIACTQTDIKRVLAYSTISQIGFMMAGMGVSGYGGDAGLGFMGALFHLFTHAFFKSLLFLAAGAIIHQVGSNEISDMGGLRRTMPLTHLCFLSGCLAIAGIPPFSGFFSKEEILLAAFGKNGFVYGILLFSSMLTAYYMFRLYFSVFHYRRSEQHLHHPEATLSMKFPLVVLALCALFAGFVDFPKWISSDGFALEAKTDWRFSLIPVLLAAGSIAIAYRMYGRENPLPGAIARRFGTIYVVISRKLYFDEIYLFITKKIIFNLIGQPAAWFDRQIVDGSVNASGRMADWISRQIKGFQSGKLQLYALYFFAGVAGLTLLFLYVWK
jgi:NADH-quinone oxidoreductase subunit L